MIVPDVLYKERRRNAGNVWKDEAERPSWNAPYAACASGEYPVHRRRALPLFPQVVGAIEIACHVAEVCVFVVERAEIKFPHIFGGVVVRSEERRVGKECRSRWS